MPNSTFDAIVIGGSFAGLSATMYLARSRCRVLLIDAGKPRNRFTDASHGFLGQDGKAPEAIRATGRAELAAYDNVTFLDGEATSARPEGDGFLVVMSDGRQERSRRLVLATGVTDILPEADGLAERWGRSVLHCPFCHGYEYRDRELGVLATGPASAHQGDLIPDWGPTTYFTQGEFEPSQEELARLSERGVIVERTPVVELLGRAPALEAVRLADGRAIPLAALFTAPGLKMTSAIAEQLGCVFEEGPQGPYLKVDGMQQTSVKGVFAAGDMTAPMHSALLASSAGMMAGVCAYRSLAV
jgi:thioredoxin reductase